MTHGKKNRDPTLILDLTGTINLLMTGAIAGTHILIFDGLGMIGPPSRPNPFSKLRHGFAVAYFTLQLCARTFVTMMDCLRV